MEGFKEQEPASLSLLARFHLQGCPIYNYPRLPDSPQTSPVGTFLASPMPPGTLSPTAQSWVIKADKRLQAQHRPGPPAPPTCAIRVP